MNTKNLVIFSLKVIVCVLLSLITGYYLAQLVGNDRLLNDLGAFVYVISFFTTIYTLISAFVLVQVWQQSNSFEQLTEQEALTLKKMWIYTDYFDDPPLSENMQKALLTYINKVTIDEVNRLKMGVGVPVPSQEFEAIGTVIDSIKFDDSRDSVAFSSIIATYSELLNFRSSRNHLGVTRLPKTLDYTFRVLAILTLGSFMLLGTHNLLIYFVSVGTVAFTESLIDLIIHDIDNPFTGLIVYKSNPFAVARTFIEQRTHAVRKN